MKSLFPLTHRMRFDDIIDKLSLKKTAERTEPKHSLTRDEKRRAAAADRDRRKVARAEWAIRLGARIRRRREFLGMSSSELAAKAGYKGSSYILEIERGVCVPNDEVLKKICAAMGEPFDDEESDEESAA